ncbi:MAG: VanW family protein [Schwartzia sp.]|nr:VanW family protein [Schwartzia sp. (in: firmicutes)]
MKAVRNLLFLTAAGLALVLVADMTFLGTAASFLRDGRMAYGLTINSKPVGGMTREEAAREVQRAAESAVQGEALVLTLPGEEGRPYSFSASEVGLSADVDAMLDAAYQVGRDGSTVQNFFTMLQCALKGKNIPFVAKLDEAKLTETLRGVKKAVDRAPKDAWMTFTAAGVERHAEAMGRSLHVEALIETVRPKLLELKLPCRTTIEPAETEPSIHLEDLNAIDGILSSATTYYIDGTGRGDNIEIAAAALDECIVRPGEELSFNATVGSRVASAGYAIAPVIVNGKVEQDIGGGVCQVSSTLYNAILTAGLEPTARTSHFYPSTYVDAGLDATVADGQIDFVFQNTLPHPVLLRSGASGGTLTVSVYGHSADVPGDIEMETVVIGPPPTVEVYRVTYLGGKMVSREYMYTDEYDVPPPPEDENPKPAADGSETEPAPAPAPAPSPAPEPEAVAGPAAPQPSPAPSAIPKKAGIL